VLMWEKWIFQLTVPKEFQIRVKGTNRPVEILHKKKKKEREREI